MQQKSLKKRSLQLQIDNGTQTRLNEINSAKKTQRISPQTKTNVFKYQNPLINIPQPKRAPRYTQQKVGSQKNLLTEKQQVSKLIKGLEIEEGGKNRQKQKGLKAQNTKPALISPKINGRRNQNDQTKINQTKKHHKWVKKDNIGEILSFYLGQNAMDKGDKLEQSMKTVYEWQNQQIKRFVEDPNLGDYIIKLPNPDNLSEQYFDLFPSARNEQQKCDISYQNAVQFYNDMFSVQNASKRRLDRQMSAFTIAYYFLNLQQNILQERSFIKDNKIDFSKQQMGKGSDDDSQEYFQFVEKEVKVFKIVLDYYTQIQSLELDEFKLVRKTLTENLFTAFQVYQSMVKEPQKMNITDTYTYLAAVKPKYSTGDLDMEVLVSECKNRTILNDLDLSQHKKTIYEKFLTVYVQKCCKNLNEYNYNRQFKNEQLGYGKIHTDDSLFQKAKNKYHFLVLIKSLHKTSTLFTYFMNVVGAQFFNFIKKQFNRKGSQRKIFKGKSLQKVMMGENMMWMNNKSKPKDLYTLLRNCLIYQLTQNCLFRTRAFLAKNENYIMLVIKASQEVLQYYAQKNEISMEVQIGATDIFSFEPVDMYERPLRLNSYIRDEEFIEKYSLRSNKMDKDEQTENKSIQSEALNIYKKAQKMNPDQLRAKIILDQEDADECYRWIRNKLNIKFIDDSNILTNEKNKEQIDRQTWQCYYIYNKLIISFISRIRKIMQTQSESTENNEFLEEINKNIGFMLRIMFVKAIAMVNDFFYKNRQTRSVVPNGIRNLFISKRNLKNLWDRMDIRQPTGYTQYVKNTSLERIWRKYQINELKHRSKFFPAQRLNICNKIVNKYINIGRSIQKLHIASYYPLHDPFILKGIKIEPYLLNLKRKIEQPLKQKQRAQTSQKQIYNMYVLYESKYSAQDFTKLSVEEKLGMNNSLFKYFSVQTVRFYCGEKIAFYFQFMRYLTKQSFPYLIFCFIIQIFLWVEQTQVLSVGETSIGSLNDVLVFIMTLFNMFWTTNTVEHWKWEEKNLAEKFGVAKMTEKDEKIVTFVGEYKRNFETDQMNYQYVPEWKTVVKSIFTFVVNLLYVTLVCLVIIQIFVLKSVLFQSGFPQSTVNILPSILIAISVQIFNYLYIFLIKLIIQFQNHKTISSFQRSLISKSYTITFVITFISIFIYAFFSAYLDGDYLCIIKTTETKEIIYSCSYFVSSQLLSLVIVDLIFTLVAAAWPYVNFKVQEYRQNQKQRPRTKFYFNKFEAIDEFYEEEDKMHSNMFNGEVDNSWIGYMNVISVFTALALFGPALPFVYVMMFVSSLVRLHASKYQLILLAKRSIPTKTNTINQWLTVIETISFVSIITNIAYMIYTRQVFTSNQTQIFFFFILAFLLLKFYLLMQYDDKLDVMGERNKRRVEEVLVRRVGERVGGKLQQGVNTDVLNVYYDQVKLKRIAPKIRKANVRFKNHKKGKLTDKTKIV